MIFYVDRAGNVDFRRPYPKSEMGISMSLIGGEIVNGFVPLSVEPFLKALIWDSSPKRYQQLQIQKEPPVKKHDWAFWGEVTMGVVVLCLLILVTIEDFNLEGVLQ